ncbi:hypothetical protein EDB85DRAFT_1889051 [Lactarius pseudohatsudake]|nr:hypothetical protein EDB85DRAFT_1889051 [Lactarius pseudohatsudake]
MHTTCSISSHWQQTADLCCCSNKDIGNPLENPVQELEGVKQHKASGAHAVVYRNAKAARKCGGVGTAGYMEPDGQVVASNWKWSRMLRRGTKLCIRGHQGQEHVGFESLRMRASAACWECKG